MPLSARATFQAFKGGEEVRLQSGTEDISSKTLALLQSESGRKRREEKRYNYGMISKIMRVAL